MDEDFTRRIVVSARRTGNGRRPWAWTVHRGDEAVPVAASEPMFVSRDAAVRVGSRVLPAILAASCRAARAALH